VDWPRDCGDAGNSGIHGGRVEAGFGFLPPCAGLPDPAVFAGGLPRLLPRLPGGLLMRAWYRLRVDKHGRHVQNARP